MYHCFLSLFKFSSGVIVEMFCCYYYYTIIIQKRAYEYVN